MGRDHFDLIVPLAQGIVGAHHLALARIAASEIAEPNRMAQAGAVCDRGHPALIVGHAGCVPLGKEMRTGLKRHRQVSGAQANQHQLVVGVHAVALGQGRADRILGFRHHPAQPEVQRRCLPGQFVARRVALFDPHHAKRFGPVGHRVKFFARRHQRPDQPVAVPRGHGDFISQFARERDPEQPRARATANRHLAAGHEREGLVRDVVFGVDHLAQQVARIGSGHGELRPAVGDRDQVHIQIGPQALAREFHVAKHHHRVGRGRGHDKVVVRQSRGGAVVVTDPVFAQHQPVSHLAHGQLGKAVGVDFVDEFSRVASLNVDLAKRRHVADADRGARHLDLAVDAVAPAFLAGAREPLGAQPHAGLDEFGPLFFGPGVAGGQAEGAEVFAARPTRECADGHPGVGRAEDCRAGLGDRLACGLGQNRHAQHVCGLALIGGHAQRGVAFKKFNRPEAFGL